MALEPELSSTTLKALVTACFTPKVPMKSPGATGPLLVITSAGKLGGNCAFDRTVKLPNAAKIKMKFLVFIKGLNGKQRRLSTQKLKNLFSRALR